MAEKSEKKTSPFDYVKSIQNGKAIPMGPEYVPFVVNRAVAHHRDCIHSAQMLNELNVSPEQHYTFLYHAVSKTKRPFERWVPSAKGNSSEDEVNLAAKYFQCSIEVAREYLTLLSQSEIEELKSAYGGKES
jgi:hypothetical protein